MKIIIGFGYSDEKYEHLPGSWGVHVVRRAAELEEAEFETVEHYHARIATFPGGMFCMPLPGVEPRIAALSVLEREQPSIERMSREVLVIFQSTEYPTGVVNLATKIQPFTTVPNPDVKSLAEQVCRGCSKPGLFARLSISFGQSSPFLPVRIGSRSVYERTFMDSVQRGTVLTRYWLAGKAGV